MDGCNDVGSFSVFGPRGYNHYCLYHAQRADRYSNSLAEILDQKLAAWGDDSEYEVGKDW